MSLDEFRNDVKTNYAVIRCLEIIGEASKNIPAALRNKYSEIPWKTIIGTRNVIVHEYADVDLNEVWKTTVNDLPKLKPQIQKMLRELK
jgi:uncharacterized protein with HEPN domain